MRKSFSDDWDNHLSVKHLTVEGQLEFRVLPFVPRRAPFQVFGTKKKRNNIKLYVCRVFTTDDGDELILEWLNFFESVVDSGGIFLCTFLGRPLQQKILRVTKENLVEKCLGMFADFSGREDHYKKFFENFGKCLKL